jgi:phosphoadenosine phosphosulfate reductase
MRKVLPLQSRLAELDCWITGLRREQAESRAKTGLVEVYTLEQPVQRDIVKFNPMVHWSREAIWEYIRKHKIPYNPLHDRGYRSIGCWPCTGQAAGSNHERSGRWVGFQKVECGIHTFMSRKG